MSSHETSLPPGPPQPALIQAALFGRDPYGYLRECARKWGDPFTLRLPGEPPRVVFSDPALVRQVFALRAEDYQQAGQAFPLNIGENALLFLDGERHRRERAVMTPPLHGERLRGYGAIMSETAAEATAGWKPGEHVAIHPFLQRLTIDILLRCMFGFAEGEILRAPLAEWVEGTLSPILFFLSMAVGSTRLRRGLDSLTRRNDRRANEAGNGSAGLLGRLEAAVSDKVGLVRGARAKAALMRELRNEVESCRASPTNERTDILGLLATARYEDGALLDVEHVVDELVMLLIGGHETTANTLAWALGHILARPRVVEKIRAELASVFGGGPVVPSRTNELVYIEACIKEAMRLTPIAPAIPRGLARPLRLGALDLEPGTILWPSVYLTHTRADLWPEPDEYRPERFIDTPNPSKNNFFPFGGGRRACLGMAFATVEMRVILAELFSRADLALASSSPPRPEFRGMTVAPADGLTMIALRIRGVRSTEATVSLSAGDIS